MSVGLTLIEAMSGHGTRTDLENKQAAACEMAECQRERSWTYMLDFIRPFFKN